MEEKVLMENNIVEEVKESYDDKKALKFLGMQNQLDNFKSMKEDIKKREKLVLDDEEISNKIDEKIQDLTVEAIKALTPEQVDGIYTIDGEVIDITAQMNISDKNRVIQFKKDFLLYKKASIESFKEIDRAMDQLEAEIEKDFEEFQKVVQQYGDITTYLREDIINRYNNATIDETKARYKTMLDNMDLAFTFDHLYDHYSTANLSNVMTDYERRADSVYERYMKTVSKLKTTNVDLTVFNDLELKYLPEKYHKYPNLFLFTVIRHYSYRKDKAQKNEDGVFLAQLSINLKKLERDKFTEEEKAQFLSNIQKVLDLFY